MGNGDYLKPTIIRKDYARARARISLKESGVVRPPTNLERICNEIGVQVHYHCTEGMEDSFMFLHHSVYHIVIAISGYQTRDRWSLAHELGHILLGHCNLYKVDTLDKDFLTEAERYILDREADIFAEELLMPIQWVEKHRDSSINQLRKVFNVSKEAITIRINNLPYVSKESAYSGKI